MENRNKVRGIAHDLNVAKVTVRALPDRPGIAAAIFEPLAAANISVDCIVQNASVNKIADLSFTVSRSDLRRALQAVEQAAASLGAKDCTSDSRLAKVSIVGTGMISAPGYASRMFQTLAQEGINIELITTSEIRITCLIDEAKVHDAVRALHRAFALEKAEV